jgi:aspartate racemase
MKMKKVGLIGGIGPPSTLDYYKGIISGYRQKTGDINYPEIIIYSINMTEMLSNIEKEHWDKVISQLTSAAGKLSAAGADFAVMASNTPHLVFDEISKKSLVPLISIVEETCKFSKEALYQRVLTIGTLFTMKSGLYGNSLKKHGMTPLLPSDEEQKEIYSLLYPVIENGSVIKEDKEKMIKILDRIVREQNADSLILGCTELPLMIKQEDLPIPVIDTTQIHIESITNYMIS